MASATANQIVERKVIEAILAEAKVTEMPVSRDSETDQEFAVFHSVLGTKDVSNIPQALHDDTPGEEGKGGQGG